MITYGNYSRYGIPREQPLYNPDKPRERVITVDGAECKVKDAAVICDVKEAAISHFLWEHPTGGSYHGHTIGMNKR